MGIISICFLGILNHDLWTPDEPRAAAISLEMSHTGNFVIPFLAGNPFIEKPPLYFAAAAGLIKTMGPVVGNTGAIRFTSALFGLFTLLATFLLARCLKGRSFAFLSIIILGTMEGFVENFHWIRVDAALSFFVVSAIWCFAEVYLKKRPWFLPLAGLFTACAFLSKGLIGPLLIAIPWAVLFFIWLKQNRGTDKKNSLFVLQHILCTGIFIFISGLWIVLLRIKGGQDLWNQWFWVNQVGRLTGSASKGHHHSGEPFYYLITMAMYSMPWLPLIIIWIFSAFKRLWQDKTISKENMLLLIWGAGTILILSISVTKRSIYLSPALPAFAMMCALVLEEGPWGSFEIYSRFWSVFCTIIMIFLTILPFTVFLAKKSIPERMFSFISTFGFNNYIAGAGVIICLYLLLNWKKTGSSSSFFKFAIITIVFYLVMFLGPMKAIDLEKSMKSSIQEFAGHISTEARPHVAGWNFNETMRANFYYYCNWSVPQIKKKARVQTIING